MPRAQRYKVERRAGAVVAASSFSLALLELWAPLAAALLRAALLAWGSTADAVTCTAERATRVIDCIINSWRHCRAGRLPRTPEACRRRSQSDVRLSCKDLLSSTLVAPGGPGNLGTRPSEASRRQMGRVTGARGNKNRRSPSRQRSVKRLPKRRRTGRSSVAQRGK